MNAVWLGHIGYREALIIQLRRVEARTTGEVGDTLLLLTHPHVYTLGRSGNLANLLVSEESLAREGIVLERITRGGDITYHGPGQLVGYPIVMLENPDVHRFVRSLEAAIIEVLALLGVYAHRMDGLTGVWAGDKKIASIGIAVRRRVTYHGFALNINTDLSYFRKIHICGLKGREATSIAELTGKQVPMEEIRDLVANACTKHLLDVLGRPAHSKEIA